MSCDVIMRNLPFLMNGLWVTLKLSFICAISSMLLGFVLGVLRYLKLPILGRVVGLFVDVTRSIPLILYIIFIHFSISPYLYSYVNFLRYIGFDSLEMYSASIAIILFSSAYIAEIVRSGFLSVPGQQILAAKALGLNRIQVLECVVIPQSLSKMRPALCAQVVSLVKDTSLASTIGLIEFTRSAEIVYETSFHEFQLLSFVAIVYITINFLVQKLFYLKEKMPVNFE